MPPLSAVVRGLPRVYWTLWTGLLVNRLATFVVPFMSLYLTRERGLDAGEAGLVVSLWGLGAVAGNLLGGFLADRVGRRPTLAAGLVIGGAVAVTLGFVRDVRAVAALTCALGLFGDLYRPALQAAVADVVPPPDRVRAYALLYWAVNLGTAVGLAAAGFVAERSFAALFVLDGATSLAFAAVVLARVPETRPAVHAAHEPALRGLSVAFRDGHLLAFLGVNLVTLLVYFQFQVALPVDMAGHGIEPSTYGALMALNGAGVVLLQAPVLALVARRDPGRVLALAALLTGAGYAFHGVGHTPALYALGVMIWTVGEVVGEPFQASTVASLAPPDRRGRYQGALSMSWGLGNFLAPAIGGAVLARSGGGVLWGACLLLGGLAAALHLVIAGPRRRRLEGLAADEAPAPVGRGAEG
ncbi:MAG: MFS transporter [Anaeromyxobacter sp.]